MEGEKDLASALVKMADETPEEASQEAADPGLEAAAEDFASCAQSGDYSGMARAFKAMFDIARR